MSIRALRSGPTRRTLGGRLAVEGLRYSFPGKSKTGPLAVLHDFSIVVEHGELISLVGPSGCGKSTLLNIIAGLIKPDAGRVLIGDQDVTGTSGNVAYMMQDDLLLPWRTVVQNVTVGSDLRCHGKAREAARERARSLMGKFGLSGFEDYYPGALSGGMRQRVAFMRTVLCDRQVLLLDEPFRGLDAITKGRMHEWLMDLWQEFHLTILFITHDPEEAVFLSDRMYVLSQRPATVTQMVPVELPRPRRHDILGSAECAHLKGRVLDELWMSENH